VAGVGDADVAGGPHPPWQEVVPELLGGGERPALRVVGPGDAVSVAPGHGLEVPLVEGLVAGAVGLDVAGRHDSSSWVSPLLARGSWQPPLARIRPWPFPDLSVCLPPRTGRPGRRGRGRQMGGWTKARIQLCGRFAVEVDGA